MIATDTAALVVAIGSVLIGIIGAIFSGIASLRAGRLAQPVSEVHAAVSTPEGKPPLGVIASDASDTLEEVQTVVTNGNTPPAGTPKVTAD